MFLLISNENATSKVYQGVHLNGLYPDEFLNTTFYFKNEKM